MADTPTSICPDCGALKPANAWCTCPKAQLRESVVAALNRGPNHRTGTPVLRCTTPGCPGDGRYAAPGRGHRDGCTYPLPVPDTSLRRHRAECHSGAAEACCAECYAVLAAFRAEDLIEELVRRGALKREDAIRQMLRDGKPGYVFERIDNRRVTHDDAVPPHTVPVTRLATEWAEVDE